MLFLEMGRTYWRSPAQLHFISMRWAPTVRMSCSGSVVQSEAGLKYDSWVTIGFEDNYMNALTAFLMDFSEFEQGGRLFTDNGAWFVTPDMRQAAAGPDGKLLLMQLTTEGEVSGRLNIHGRTRPLPLTDNPDSLVPRLIDVRQVELSIR